MKKITLLIFILSLSIVHSQSFLQTVNGSKFEYEKISFKKGSILIKNGQEKTEFNPNDVYGYYSFNYNAFYFRKDNVDNVVGENFSSPLKINLDVTKDYFFIERIVEGKIKLYRKEITVHRVGGFSTDVYWYLEKDGDFYCIHIKGKIFAGNKRKFEIFLNQILTETDLSNEMRNKDYKNKIKDILEIVKIYNLKTYNNNQHELSDSQKNKIVFYRDNKNQIKEKLIFSIGSTEYSLNKNEKLELDLPVNKESMVCIKNDPNRTCELILAHDYFITYYEVSLNKKKGRILRKNGNSSYTKARLKYIGKMQEKRNN